MKKSTSYSIVILNLFNEQTGGSHTKLYLKSLKVLRKKIKMLLETKEYSFEVYKEYRYAKNLNKTPVSFEFYGYDHTDDSVFKYNLRDNIYKSDLRRCERVIGKLMKTYNYSKNEELL